MQTNVLLVDDHPVFRKGLSLLLEKSEEINVIGEAGDGQAAVALARELSPDVIVMDISLPDLSGIEATRQILADHPDTKILALSMHGEKRFVDDMLGSGAAGYILKESAPEELLEGIWAVVDGQMYLSASIKQIVLNGYLEYLSDKPAQEEQADESSSMPLLTSKLYPPAISERIVPRTRLLKLLDDGRWRPATMVSAPAGCGKSTLVSQWLNHIEGKHPGAWLSLDEHDNDLHSFTTYLAAAIQAQFPQAFQETALLLNAPSLPPVQVLARTIVNELEGVPQRFILVLDDYHRIVEESIHELLAEILRHPPKNMHLVLITRADPPLELLQLQAKQRLGVVRTQALNFTVAETTVFLQKVVGTTVEARIAKTLTERTDGWVTGLHLMTLYVHNSNDLNNLSSILPGEQQSLDYLAAEALSRQPYDIQAWLLKTSILDRFSAALCQAVCMPPGEGQAASLNGERFIQWLLESNLFLVPLDHNRQWFRYHHLFQELLKNQLGIVLEPEFIAALHARACSWLVDNGMPDEAFDHALAAGDISGAAEIVEQYRHSEHEASHWHVIEKWLARLPAEIKQQRPGLLLTQAWLDFVHFKLEQIPALLAQVEPLLDQPTTAPLLLAELNFFKGNLFYWQGEAETSVQHLEEALTSSVCKEPHVESNIELMLALARCASGRKESAIQSLNDRIRSIGPPQDYLLTYLIAGLAFIHLLSGELDQALVHSQRLHDVARKSQLTNSYAWSLYLQAIFHLQTGELEQAARSFAATDQQHYALDRVAVIDTLAGLALAQQLMQLPQDASQTMERLLDYVQELGAPEYLSLAHSCRARLSLLQGDLTTAAQWAQSVNGKPFPAGLFLWLEVPSITQARVLIACGSEEDLSKASELLREIRQLSEAYFYTGQTIEVAVLQSLALSEQGGLQEALEALEDAVSLSSVGNWIRPYLEIGQPMAHLLKQLKKKGTAPHLEKTIDQILTAFPLPPSLPATNNQHELLNPLTERELQVLRHLAATISIREIAEQLVVSENTVRMHTKNIYSKLDAHSRIEAVQQAHKFKLI